MLHLKLGVEPHVAKARGECQPVLVVAENRLTAERGRWSCSGFGSLQEPIQKTLGIVADGWIRAFAPMPKRVCVL